MSIRRDLVIKVSNGTATLDMPLQIYEKDHGIELRFKLMDYKYKYDKDPENILNSNKEDILEAYTTIVNPSGYELAQINGEVVDDTIKFMIEDSYTDELEELGTYQLQIHVKCTHSEFSIPPVRFEVLERLKGEKVVTDGDDEVDYSDIIDGSTKFIDDETGKLIIQWQKGDTISSVRLNAMVEVINNAVDEEAQRQLNEVEREQQELEREQQELERENRLQAALDSVDARVDESMNEYETRFNALTASQQQDAEVIDARDSEVSLKARLDRDVSNPLQVYEDVEGIYITCDSTDGYAQNVEILGDTIQDEDNLADIRSVGDKVEGRELYEIDVLSCGKNLCNPNDFVLGKIIHENTGNLIENVDIFTSGYIPIKKGVRYIRGLTTTNYHTHIYDKNKKWLKRIGVADFIAEIDGYYRFSLNKIYLDSGIMMNVGDKLETYEPYQEDKLTILSPVQLEKVGYVADRIICKDGVWGVEKNVCTIMLNGSETWKFMGYADFENTIGFIYYPSNNIPFIEPNIVNYMSDKFISLPNNNWQNDIECCIILNNSNIGIKISKSKLSTPDIASFKAWLQANNISVKYQNTNPIFIPLPHDQQVKLRTFAGETNISFLTEIEGTIKAQIPHSLGATVNSHSEQIDNLSEELDRVKKLEESAVSTVVTESGFTTVTEATNGYFEDVKLEGKTLVNLIMRETVSIAGENGIIAGNENFGKSNGVYSLTSKNDSTSMRALRYEITFTNLLEAKNLEFSFCLDSPIDSAYQCTFVDESGTTFEHYERYAYTVGKTYIRCKLPTAQKIKIIRIYVDKNGVSTNTSTTFKLTDVMILEGDHTQNPPEYFEGLMSVGEDVDEMSIATLNNLFNDNDITRNTSIGGYPESLGKLTPNNYTHVSNYIPVIANNEYIFNYEYETISNTAMRAYVFYDKFKNIIPLESDKQVYDPTQKKHVFVPKNDGYLRLGYDINCKNIRFVNCKNIVDVSKQDKKPLLYYNPTTQVWEKPVLREWDSIEKHSDGKYYYHKRSGEVTFSGSEDWVDNNVNSTGCYYLVLNEYPSIKCKTDSSLLISNTLKWRNGDVWTGNGSNEMSVNRDDGILYVFTKTTTLSEFKTWLQSNPTTVVYQLATEEVYECTNIDLITYANETNLIVKSGALNPKTTLKVHSNVANVVTLLQKKTLKLEESTTTHDRRIAAIETKLETPAVQVEGSYISCDSTDGYIQNVEILGNTIQDADNLADIRSVGDDVEGQELYKIDVVSVNENLFSGFTQTNSSSLNYYDGVTNTYVSSTRISVESFYACVEVHGCSMYMNFDSEGKVEIRYKYTNDKQSSFEEAYTNTNDVTRNIVMSNDESCKYLVITFRTLTENSVAKIRNISITRNKTVNSYTPHQSDKLTILSPAQLEKVGDAADRIICKDGVWGVENNTDTIVLNGSESWKRTGSVTDNTLLFYTTFDAKPCESSTVNLCISDKFPSATVSLDAKDVEGIYTAYDGNICIRIDKTKLPTQNLEGFVAWLQANPTLVKYQTKASTFIPLPHDQQVKLRTFAGETNISFLTEIEPTLKAQIPQSISATISTHTEQIDNLNKELNRVKKLEESAVSTVTTESMFTTVTETTNGYFEDVKLEGKTLVNLPPRNGVNGKSIITYNYTALAEVNYLGYPNLDVNKTYTFIIEGDNKNFAFGIYNNTNGVSTNILPYDYDNVIKFNPISTDDTRIYIRTLTEGSGQHTHKIILLEGDHTQNPPGYFEGLMSVGEDVEEVSVESVNENLFDFNKEFVKVDKWFDVDGTIIDNYSNGLCVYDEFIPIPANVDCIVGDKLGGQVRICFYDKNKRFVKRSDLFNDVLKFNENASYIKIGYRNVTGDITSTRVNVGSVLKTTKSKQDKKPLLYYNPTTQVWEKPILREWDSIEKHSDGKYYYHKRSNEIVLNGSESNWSVRSVEGTGKTSFGTALDGSKPCENHLIATVICDKFTANTTTKVYECLVDGVSINKNSWIYFSLNSELANNSSTFNQWLQSNPTTLVYQLAQEEVYECINIDLITYENETNYIVNTGAIAPLSTLKVMCNINNVVRELQQKVSNLENYIQHVMIDALNNALNE